MTDLPVHRKRHMLLDHLLGVAADFFCFQLVLRYHSFRLVLVVALTFTESASFCQICDLLKIDFRLFIQISRHTMEGFMPRGDLARDNNHYVVLVSLC